MKRFGLIGYPLGHSYSGEFFTKKFASEKLKDHEYELFPIKNLNDFDKLLCKTPDLAGLNVTIPYKKSILQHCHIIDDIASACGSVNTLRISRQDNIVVVEGFNTDYYGFSESIRPLLKKGMQALILGNGGVAGTVKCVLHAYQIPFLTVSRKTAKDTISWNEITAALLEEHTLIINTTPLGMYPDVAAKPPIPYQFLSSKHSLFDMVYNPEETSFLRDGKKQGAFCLNGLGMFNLQAEEAYKIWIKADI